MEVLDLYDITDNPTARDYFLNQLAMGTTLAARVREAVDFSRGKILVALSDGTDPGNLPKYEESGNIRWRRRGFATLAHVAKQFLALDQAAILLQDTVPSAASAREDWFRDYRYRDHVVLYNQEVYWHLDSSELDEDDILGLLYSASFYPFSAFFYMQARPGRCSHLCDAHLNEVVKNLVGVSVGVFDEESFLLWWNDRVPLPVAIESG